MVAKDEKSASLMVSLLPARLGSLHRASLEVVDDAGRQVSHIHSLKVSRLQEVMSINGLLRRPRRFYGAGLNRIS